MKVFESVGSCSGLHLDPEGTVLVGGEFPFFGNLLVSTEDEVAYFEFPFYDFLAVTSSYFFVLALLLARSPQS
jgi:hypothetical protein